ncbi:MAG TPA: hypothetical protein ACFCUD_06250 [Cyclobacteriaceae bacterium]
MNLLQQDHVLINTLSIATVLLRIMIFICLMVLYWLGGFDQYEIKILVYLLGPITMLYLAAFLRFALRFPYTSKRASFTRLGSGFSFLFVLTIHLIEITLIVLNALYKTTVLFPTLSFTLFALESLHGIFIATRLARLIEIRE